MKRLPDRLRPLWPLLLLVGLVLGVSIGFILAYQSRFRLSFGVIPTHLVLVGGALLLSLLIAASLRSWFPHRDSLAAVPVALLIVGLGTLDVINWVARGFWVEVLSLRTILFYLPRIYAVAAGATEANGFLILGGIAATAILLLVTMFWFAPRLCSAITHAVDDTGGLALFGSRPARRAFLAAAVWGWVFGTGYWWVKDKDFAQAEPLVSLFPGDRTVSTSNLATIPHPPNIRSVDGGPTSLLSNPAPITVQAHRKNVVIIVIDSLRPDHLSLFGYERETAPALMAFATAGPAIVADWATSSCSISNCGISSILGSAQYRRQLPGLPTLPQLLRDAGYETFFVVSGDFTRGYPVLHDLFAATARVFVDGLTHDHYTPNDDRNITEALGSIPPRGDKPGFFYFHLHSAHRGGTKYREPTWRPALIDTTEWAALNAIGGSPSAGKRVPYDPTVQRNDYDNAIRQADDVVAQILSSLSERGYLDHSVVVLTADHGEGLGEHGNVGHGHDLYAEDINVPLVIRDRTFSASRRVPYARQVDIAPTILECLDLPAPPAWEGHSLLSGTSAESYHQTTTFQPIQALLWRTTAGSYKYIVDTKTGAEALFDLDRDPGERVNTIATASPAVLGPMRSAFAENFGTQRGDIDRAP